MVMWRHGGLPVSKAVDRETGEITERELYLEAVAWHLDYVKDIEFSLDNWARRVGAKIKPIQIARTAAKVQREPRKFGADALAKMLRVTDEERTALGIKTIGCIEVSKRQRALRRKDHDRERKRARRLAAGATPQEQSASRKKPWVERGQSRATYYRARARQNAISTP